MIMECYKKQDTSYQENAFFYNGGMNRLQICMFDSDFHLQQVRILNLDVKVKNVQL